MEIQQSLDDFKRVLEEIYGERLAHLILYGSWARGEATPASDIDLLVVLKGHVDPGQEIDRLIDMVTDLSLKYDTLFSICPISEADYRALHSPLLINVRQEGIAL